LVLLLVGRSTSAQAESLLPGSPLNGGSFGTLDLTLGGTLLPGTVVPGDVVLRESLTGGDALTNASDIVRFTNIDLTSMGFPGVSVGMAFLISDGETGGSPISSPSIRSH
jgi:hypothetical protein